MTGPPKDSTRTEVLAVSITSHVRALCNLEPDRSPGSPGNRDAVAYVETALEGLGLEVESLPFETFGWRAGAAALDTGGETIPVHPGPYSPSYDGSGPLAVAASVDEIGSADARESILLLHGPVAAEQLTPRGYPWYDNPSHDAILDAIEAAAPACVIAATGTDPASAAGLSPFPLIEDAGFDIPSAYVSEDLVPRLRPFAGTALRARIDSERFVAACSQPIGRLRGRTDTLRVLVTSHLDTKPGTPGALDNASGVAVMLAVAELLRGDPPRLTVEFVAFNGEDHFASPGEVAYLDAYPDASDVALVINIDGAGYTGRPTALSRFGIDGPLETAVDSALADHPRITEGEPWLSGDHAIFVMRNVPALALTSGGMRSLWATVPHTHADTPDVLDPGLLAHTARFVAGVVRALDRRQEHHS